MPSSKFFSMKSWILIGSIAILTLPASGQNFYGSIAGTVNDASNAAIAGANVTLINSGTGERRTATSGPDGGYRFVSLVPGSYRVEIEQAGFKRYTRSQIAVEVDSVVRVHVAMQVGEVTQAVEVTAEAPLMQTENASLQSCAVWTAERAGEHGDYFDVRPDYQATERSEAHSIGPSVEVLMEGDT